MHFEIKSLHTNTVIYTANISDDARPEMQVRLALEQAVSHGVGLRGADLCGADLRDADLGELRSLQGTIGNGAQIKSLQFEAWPITYTAEHMQIGCQMQSLKGWWEMSDNDIDLMDPAALEWWQRWKPVLRQIIAMSPAELGAEAQVVS